MKLKTSQIYESLLTLYLHLKECFKRDLINNLSIKHQWLGENDIIYSDKPKSDVFCVEIGFWFQGYTLENIRCEFQILKLSDEEYQIDELTFKNGSHFCFFENDVNIPVCETGLVFFQKEIRKWIDFAKNKVDTFCRTSTNARFYSKNLIHCKKQKSLVEFDEHFLSNVLPNYKSIFLFFDLQLFAKRKLQKRVQSFTRIWDKKKWCILENQITEMIDTTLSIEVSKRQAMSSKEYQYCFVPKTWTFTETKEKQVKHFSFDFAWEGKEIVNEIDKLNQLFF